MIFKTGVFTLTNILPLPPITRRTGNLGKRGTSFVKGKEMTYRKLSMQHKHNPKKFPGRFFWKETLDTLCYKIVILIMATPKIKFLSFYQTDFNKIGTYVAADSVVSIYTTITLVPCWTVWRCEGTSTRIRETQICDFDHGNTKN